MKKSVLYNINEKIKIEITTNLSQDEKIIAKVKYAALNHRDLWIQKGQYAGLKFPITLGSDACVEYKNKEYIINPGFNWGSNEKFQTKEFNILGLPSDGCFAESVAVEEGYLYPKPEHLSTSEAAALPLAGLTAYRALFSRANIQPNEKILITGIGGGVALFGLQLAIAHGLEVYVTSSSQTKIDNAITLGAKGGITYSTPDWEKEMMTKSGGFDIILDGACGADFSKLIKLANPGCRISIYGATNGSLQNISPQMIFWKQLNILGSTMGSDKDFQHYLDFINLHKIKPIIDTIYPLEQINDAFTKMQDASQFGKILLEINP